LVIVQNRQCLNLIFALLASRCSIDGPPTLAEALRRLIKPRRIAAISFRRGTYPSGMLLEFMPEILGEFVKVQRFSSIQPDLAARLEEFNPNSITGYASVLEALASLPHPPKLPRLVQLTNSSEQVSGRARGRIEQTFCAPLLDHYGTGECLQLADGCPHCGQLHINDDWAILESVDDQNRPVPAGVTGHKVLITNLANHTQPFIRYEVGDRVALAADCCTWRKTTRIQRIEGRSGEVFWVQNEFERRFLPGILFHAALDSVDRIQDWQAIQRSSRRIELRFVPIAAASHEQTLVCDLIERSLIERGLPEWIELDVRVVDQLPPNTRTGKMQRIVIDIDSQELTEHPVVSESYTTPY
jgi:phenylacetate-coenzyme A ligase PaaK-like adenylate-forming protein